MAMSGVPTLRHRGATARKAVLRGNRGEARFEQSRVSHNLGCLLNCGFVQWKWQGKNKVYRLHPDLLPILNAIDKHLARYAPALKSCGVLEGEAKQAVFLARTSGRRQSQRRRGRLTVKA